MRELENVLQRAVVVAKGGAVLRADLPPEVLANPLNRSTVEPLNRSTIQPFNDLTTSIRQLFAWARHESKLKLIPAVERELIVQALLETKGNQVQAAKLLGITRATLRKRVEKFKIKRQVEIE